MEDGAVRALRRVSAAARETADNSRDTEKALRSLGVKSDALAETQRQKAVAAYEAIRTSGTASAREIAAAYAGLQNRLARIDRTVAQEETRFQRLGRAARELAASLAGVGGGNAGVGDIARGAASSAVSSAGSVVSAISSVVGKIAGIFSSAIGGLLDFVSSIASSIISTLKTTALVAAGAFAALTFNVVKTSSEFEKFGSILETVEGSSEKAKAALKWAADFAAKTPFALGIVTDAFVKLKTMGIDPTQGALEAAGNASAGMGKDVIQAVEALGDALGGENERLKEFGISAESIGNEIRYSWVKNGEILTKSVEKTNRAAIEDTIKGIWTSQFGGAMEKLSTTFDGMVSNLGDTWTRFAQKIGEAGVFAKVKSTLGGVLAYLERLTKSGKFDAWAASIGRAMTKVLSLGTDVFALLSGQTEFKARGLEFGVGAGELFAPGVQNQWLKAFAPQLKAVREFLASEGSSIEAAIAELFDVMSGKKGRRDVKSGLAGWVLDAYSAIVSGYNLLAGALTKGASIVRDAWTLFSTFGGNARAVFSERAKIGGRGQVLPVFFDQLVKDGNLWLLDIATFIEKARNLWGDLGAIFSGRPSEMKGSFGSGISNFIADTKAGFEFLIGLATGNETAWAAFATMVERAVDDAWKSLSAFGSQVQSFVAKNIFIPVAIWFEDLFLVQIPRLFTETLPALLADFAAQFAASFPTASGFLGIDPNGVRAPATMAPPVARSTSSYVNFETLSAKGSAPTTILNLQIGGETFSATTSDDTAARLRDLASRKSNAQISLLPPAYG
jgi:hypothetical protein